MIVSREPTSMFCLSIFSECLTSLYGRKNNPFRRQPDNLRCVLWCGTFLVRFRVLLRHAMSIQSDSLCSVKAVRTNHSLTSDPFLNESYRSNAQTTSSTEDSEISTMVHKGRMWRMARNLYRKRMCRAAFVRLGKEINDSNRTFWDETLSVAFGARLCESILSLL